MILHHSGPALCPPGRPSAELVRARAGMLVLASIVALLALLNLAASAA